MGRRHNDVTDQQILDLYMEESNGVKVARMLGINDRTVSNVLATHGIESIGRREYIARARRFDAEAMKDVIKRYEEGSTATQIAMHYGCATETVTIALRREGLKIRGAKTRFSPKEKEKIVSWYQDRISMKEIGSRLGCSERPIHRFLRAEHPELIRVKGSKGEDAAGWKGGRFVHKRSGYVYVKIYEDDPFWCMKPSAEGNKGYILEHRLVMARNLKHPLLDSETVHHIDGDKINNDPDNLELRHGKHGKNVVLCCLKCGSQNIGPASLNSH